MSIDNESYRAGFAEHYEEGTPVWDIGRPQPPFIKITDQIEGPILDVGCGTGTVALFFASQGKEVTAIDLVDEAIRRAKEKAAGKNLPVEFHVKDVFTLTDWNRKFASVIDSGLFHVFANDDERRGRYFEILKHVLQPGGRIYLMATLGLLNMNAEEFKSLFSEDWEIESFQEFVAEVPEDAAEKYPDIPKDFSWDSCFAVIRQKV